MHERGNGDSREKCKRSLCKMEKYECTHQTNTDAQISSPYSRTLGKLAVKLQLYPRKKLSF